MLGNPIWGSDGGCDPRSEKRGPRDWLNVQIAEEVCENGVVRGEQ